MSEKLNSKKCEPCTGNTPKLNQVEITKYLSNPIDFDRNANCSPQTNLIFNFVAQRIVSDFHIRKHCISTNWRNF